MNKNNPQRSRVWALATIAAVAFALYANTLGHDYAMDDQIVLHRNAYTQSGISGIWKLLSEDTFAGFLGNSYKGDVVGGRYRPLSLITFALEAQLFGLNSHVSHGINVLLYMLTGCLLFLIVERLWSLQRLRSPQIAGFATALLFVVHPVHTEAVANIKGRDEVLALLLVFIAWWIAVRRERPLNAAGMAAVGVLLFLATMSKESAIVWCVLVPLSLLCFGGGRRFRLLHVGVPMIAGGVLFLIVRQAVIGGAVPGQVNTILNDPFMNVGSAARIATAVACGLTYLRLLVCPVGLTVDYYPFVITVSSWGDLQVWASLAVHGTLAWLAVCGVRKRQYWGGFAFAVYALSLLPVSNLVFTVGVFVAERFLYAPSLALALVVGWLMSRLPAAILRRRSAQLATLALVFVLGGMTVNRNRDWESSHTLSLADADTHPGSVKATAAAAAVLYEQAQALPEGLERTVKLDAAVNYLERSIALLPSFVQARESLGMVWNERDPAQAIPIFLAIEQEFGQRYHTAFQLARAYDLVESPELALEYYVKAARVRPAGFAAHYNAGLRYLTERPKEPERAVALLERSVAIHPESLVALKNLAVALRLTGDLPRTVEILERARALAPNDSWVRENLADLAEKIPLAE